MELKVFGHVKCKLCNSSLFGLLLVVFSSTFFISDNFCNFFYSTYKKDLSLKSRIYLFFFPYAKSTFCHAH